MVLPPEQADLPPIDTARVERWMVRAEAGTLETGPERDFVRAREAYWDGRTEDALGLWRGMLDGPFPGGISRDAVRWLMIQACEESGRWGQAVALAREFGFDRSHPLRLGLALALAGEPEPEIRFAEQASPVPLELKARHLVVVTALVHGANARVLVDTGFSRSMVAEEFAGRIGIRRAEASVVVTDSHGRSRDAGMGLLESLTISGMTVRHWPVVIGPMGVIERWVGKVDVVLGWDLLQRAEVTWDFVGKRFLVTGPADGPESDPNVSGRKVPILAFVSPDGRPLQLFLDSGYTSKPPTLALHFNAGLLDSKVARARFRRSWRPAFSMGLHSMRVRWPRRGRDQPVWFEGWEYVMPCVVVRRTAEVQEGLQVVDGTIGMAPFLEGTFWIDGVRRRAGYAHGDAPR